MLDIAPDNPEPLERSLPPAPEEMRRSAFPFWNYHDLLIFTVMAVPCLVVGMLVVQLAAWVIPAYPEAKAAKLLPAQFIAYGLWFGCLFLLLKTKYDMPFWRSMAWKVPWDGFFWTVLGGPALAFTIGGLGLLLRTPELEMPMKDLLGDRASVAMIGIFATTLGPFCEELAFRGFLMPLLRKSFGLPVAIVGSALPFALLHGPQYAWSWRHILLITLAGSAFGWARHRTGSTAAAAMVHGTYNMTFFSAFLLQGRF
jgi:uncharacterized protein